MGKKVVFPYKVNGPGQQRFSDAVSSGARFILALGGIRSGKTFWACVEALKQIYIKGRLPTLGWIISPTYPMSLITERMWRQLCLLPDGTSLIAHEEKGKRAFLMKPSKAHPNHYFRVEIKSASDPDHLRGSSLAWAILDEAALMKPDVLDIMRGRVLDSKGLLIAATTPKGKNWVYTDWYLKTLSDPEYVAVHMPTMENSYLDQKEIENIRSSYNSKSDTFARQDLDGEFCEFEGMVFNHFRPSEHLYPARELPDSTPIYCGIDWGYNDPFVCVWLANVDGAWFVLDEYYKTRGLLGDHAAYLKNHPLWPQVKKIWCDPSGLQQRKEFLTMGINCLPARRPQKTKSRGWPEMRARLINNMFASRVADPYNPKKQIPGLVYFDNIRYGLSETTQLCYEKYTSVAQDPKTGDIRVSVVDKSGDFTDKNAHERIEDRNNHFVDALGYCLFSEVRTFGGLEAHYESPQGETVTQVSEVSQEEKLQAEVEARFQDERRRQERLKQDSLDKYNPY